MSPGIFVMSDETGKKLPGYVPTVRPSLLETLRAFLVPKLQNNGKILGSIEIQRSAFIKSANEVVKRVRW